MQSRRLIIYSALVSILITTFACKKEKNNSSGDDVTKTELLAKSTWKLDKIEANIFGTNTDITSQLDDCTIDNTLTFTSTSDEHGTGVIDEAAVKCDPSDPQTLDFTWELSNSGTILKSSIPLYPGGSTDFTVMTLTATSLVVTQEMTISPYPTALVTLTLKHP